jgi:hypothetical protein
MSTAACPVVLALCAPCVRVPWFVSPCQTYSALGVPREHACELCSPSLASQRSDVGIEGCCPLSPLQFTCTVPSALYVQGKDGILLETVMAMDYKVCVLGHSTGIARTSILRRRMRRSRVANCVCCPCCCFRQVVWELTPYNDLNRCGCIPWYSPPSVPHAATCWGCVANPHGALVLGSFFGASLGIPLSRRATDGVRPDINDLLTVNVVAVPLETAWEDFPLFLRQVCCQAPPCHVPDTAPTP